MAPVINFIRFLTRLVLWGMVTNRLLLHWLEYIACNQGSTDLSREMVTV